MLAAKHRPDPERSLLGFVVGDVEYAVPISSVRQIVNPVPLAELPHSPPAVIGVADFRGEVVPIIDMRVRLGLSPAQARGKAKWILLTVASQTVGLVVDRVTEVFGTGGVELRAVPRLGGGEELRGIEGAATREGHLVFVLDVSAFESLAAPLRQPAQARAEDAP